MTVSRVGIGHIPENQKLLGKGVILLTSAVLVSVVPVYLCLVSIWYIPFVALTDLGLIYLSVSLFRNPSRENSRTVKNRVLPLMLSGLFGFLLGSLL